MLRRSLAKGHNEGGDGGGGSTWMLGLLLDVKTVCQRSEVDVMKPLRWELSESHLLFCLELRTCDQQGPTEDESATI